MSSSASGPVRPCLIPSSPLSLVALDQEHVFRLRSRRSVVDRARQPHFKICRRCISRSKTVAVVSGSPEADTTTSLSRTMKSGDLRTTGLTEDAYGPPRRDPSRCTPLGIGFYPDSWREIAISQVIFLEVTRSICTSLPAIIATPEPEPDFDLFPGFDRNQSSKLSMNSEEVLECLAPWRLG
jgi:hypothetical protein